MCEEREQLIDYVYEECGAGDRQRVEGHLAVCRTCRDEVASLRRVRQDLLAWDVPEHGSVWRPFAPPRPRPSWRDIPAWAMAAAAGVIFLAGAAGGLATRAFFPAQAPVAVVQAAPVPARVETSALVTADDLAEIEARILDRVRVQMATSAMATRSRLANLERSWQNQLDLNVTLVNSLGQLRTTGTLRGMQMTAYAPNDARIIPVSGR